MAYYALSTIEHNGVAYNRGDEVQDLSPEQAQPLQDFGVVSEEQPETAGQIVESRSPVVAERHETAEWRDSLPASDIPHPVPSEADRIAAEHAALNGQPAPEPTATAEPAPAAEQTQPEQPEQQAQAEAPQAASENEVPAPQPVQVKVEKLK